MENKEKIKKLRFQIGQLKAALEQTKDSAQKKRINAKIAELEAEIKKITDVGNGDGSGRKPISPRGEQRPATKSPKRPGY